MKRFLKLLLISLALILGGGALTAVGFLPLTVLGIAGIVVGLGMFVYIVIDKSFI
jgi:hypothetical protein